jgi:hypothetical protein
MKPGATYMSTRVFLETIAPAVKEAGEKGDQWVDQQEFEQVFEPQRTYVSIEINLSNPVVLQKTDKEEPVPSEIVAQKTLIKWPFSKTATDDFCKQIAIAIKALTKEYFGMFENELKK